MFKGEAFKVLVLCQENLRLELYAEPVKLIINASGEDSLETHVRNHQAIVDPKRQLGIVLHPYSRSHDPKYLSSTFGNGRGGGLFRVRKSTIKIHPVFLAKGRGRKDWAQHKAEGGIPITQELLSSQIIFQHSGPYRQGLGSHPYGSHTSQDKKDGIQLFIHHLKCHQ